MLPAVGQRAEAPRAHDVTIADGGPGHVPADGKGGDALLKRVADGEPREVGGDTDDPDARVKMSQHTYRAVVSGAMTPPEAMQRHLIDVDGKLFPITLLGRWIDRSQGRDDAELERETKQRAVQARRTGSWGGAKTNGTPLPAGRPVASPADGGDPAHESAGDARRGGELMGYG